MGIVAVLDEVRQRPGMYLGGTDTERGFQLRSLEMFLAGYAVATQHHEIRDDVQDFPRAFGEFVRTVTWQSIFRPRITRIGVADHTIATVHELRASGLTIRGMQAELAARGVNGRTGKPLSHTKCIGSSRERPS